MTKTLMILTGLCCVFVCESQRHYILIQTPENWTAAQSFCRENFLDLAAFEDMEEMQRALAAAAGGWDGGEVWIGLSKGSMLRWHWSLTGKDLYGEGETDHLVWGTVTGDNCAFFKTGRLHTRSCEDKRRAVCFDGAKQGSDRYVLTTNLTTWNGARDFCRQHHTDLTSLRNDAEYQMVGEVSEGQEVYVGLFRDPWEWSDQTESSLRFWRPTQTVNTAFTDNCVALLRAESGHWGDMECSIERPFLCSYAMKDLQFTKVKVRIQDSTLDPNEPRVQESLLEQMKLELKKTTSIGVRLSWRSGSDGKVFVKKSPPGNV